MPLVDRGGLFPPGGGGWRKKKEKKEVEKREGTATVWNASKLVKANHKRKIKGEVELTLEHSQTIEIINQYSTITAESPKAPALSFCCSSRSRLALGLNLGHYCDDISANKEAALHAALRWLSSPKRTRCSPPLWIKL